MESSVQSAVSLSKAVGKEIRVLLVRRDMKQTEMAARLGVTEMWLSRRLTGTQPIDLNDLDRIAAVLQVQVADLLPRRSEGELVTKDGVTYLSGRRTNDRSVVAPDRPHLVGHTKRSHPPDASRRTARTHPIGAQ